MNALEADLEAKDRELRQVSIQRAEFMHQLNVIQNLLIKARFAEGKSELVKESLNLAKISKDDILVDVPVDIAEPKKKGQGRLKKTSALEEPKKKKGGDRLDILEAFEPEKLDFMGKYSYRERMILMNRIDIFRLFITVIIISSEMKYPRKLLKSEEKELKVYIEGLDEFENLVLNLNIDENAIWDKGRVCEKQVISFFNKFFYS